MARRSSRPVALPAGLLTAARIIGASLAYLAILELTVLLGYALGQTVVPDAARGTFGLLALGVAEAAALATVLLIWRRVDGRPVSELGLDPRCAAGRRWLKGALVAALMMGFIVLFGYTLVDGATWELNRDALHAGLALVGVALRVQRANPQAINVRKLQPARHQAVRDRRR